MKELPTLPLFQHEAHHALGTVDNLLGVHEVHDFTHVGGINQYELDASRG